jgi:poly(glycerol-phosphate) alpha-glucosyltransferase
MAGVQTPRAQGALHLPLNTLALRRGGLIKAVMLRANALAEADPARPVVIEVLAFQPRLVEDVADLVARGFLDPRVHVRSVLRALDPLTPPATVDDPIAGCVHSAAAPPASTPTLRPDPRLVVLAEPALPAAGTKRSTALDDAGRLRFVDVVDTEGRRLRREEYGTDDRLLRVQYHRPGDGRPVTHRWLSSTGECFLAVWQNPGSRFWGHAFALLDGTLVALSTPQILYRAVFEHLLRTERDPVLFSEFRDQLPNLPGLGFDPVVPAVKHPTLRRVAVVHSNHALQGESGPPLRSSPNFAALLDSLGRWDMLVTATERQRADIATQYGHPERVTVIPHFAPPPRGASAAAVDPDRFVLVARIHRKKRVDEALQAFRLVVDQNPKARLEVYGFGYGDELEDRIMALVGELGLARSVTFKGFVEDASSIYEGACATVQTSESEGFGMALLESLSDGVPVVAYDVAYGAREAIRDGVDGYVVPWGDRQAMAERLLAISRDPQLRARLGAEGPIGVARFSRERYVREWDAAIAALPVRVDDAAPPDAAVVDGQLRLRFTLTKPGVAVVRRRDKSETFEAELAADGSAALALPTASAGDILDVFLRVDGTERRVTFAGTGASDDRTWRVYATEHGNLSVKKEAPKAAAPRSVARPSAPQISLSRRAWRKVRTQSKRGR